MQVENLRERMSIRANKRTRTVKTDEERNARTTALGLARYALEYLEAALVVDEHLGQRPKYVHVSPIPAYFLLTHALELTLKAFLRGKGLSVDEISSRALGHDLLALHTKALELGLPELYQLTEEDASALQLLADLNERHQLRYIETGAKTFPSWAIAEPLAVRLHQAVAPFVGLESLTVAYPAAAAAAPKTLS